MKKILLYLITTSIFAACSNNVKTDISDNAIAAEIIVNDTVKKIENYLNKLSAEKNYSGGLLIIKDEKKIFSKGFGWADKENKIPFTERTLASIGSITKAFTATAIMKLVEENKISPDDQLKKFFHDAPSDKAGITIHQLLTHSSGFHEFLKNDRGDYEAIDKAEFLKRAFTEPLAFKPGERAVYTNVGFSILGIIIEQVSGLDYERFLNTNVLLPLGIKSIGYHYPISKNDTIAIGYQNGNRWGTHQQRFEEAGGGPFWNLKANGGLEASLDEMFLWINGFSKHTVLGENSIQKMFTEHILEEGNGGQSFFGYGCNLSKSKRNTRVISNGGSNGIYFARIVRYPEEGVVFYMVTNEAEINTSMVLPNILQLYFLGKIETDEVSMTTSFENELSKQIYTILLRPETTNLALELGKEKFTVDDDMVLLEVGQKLIGENRNREALILYEYYTQTFPNIVVAWNDLGDVYIILGKKEEAIKCYKKALSIKPENKRAKDSLRKLVN